MKKFAQFLLLLATATVLFSSCEEKDKEDSIAIDPIPNTCYIVNYGSYGNANGTISQYNSELDVLSNKLFKNANSQSLSSNIQYAYYYNDKVYLLGNSLDQVVEIDTNFVQTKASVTDKIAKPRACVASGNYLYISCLGNNPDWNLMLGSYIAKYNISTSVVEDSIPLAGGPEGLAIVNGKLYAALNYKDSVAVMDLSNNAISYIYTPAVSSYFIKDNSGNLYVSLLSTYSDPSDYEGLGYINTTTNTFGDTYSLKGLSTEYASVIAPNADMSKIYVCKASWGQLGTVYVFDTNTKAFTELITGVTGLKGVQYDSFSGTLFVFTAENSTDPGLVKIYNTDGVFINSYSVGVSPTMGFYID